MKRVCGLDVHKDTIFCATFNGKNHAPVREYLTLTTQIQDMGKELQTEKVKTIAMDSKPVAQGVISQQFGALQANKGVAIL